MFLIPSEQIYKDKMHNKFDWIGFIYEKWKTLSVDVG